MSENLPSGDSVTLIERLRSLANDLLDYRDGTKADSDLVTQAADRLAVLEQREANTLEERYNVVLKWVRAHIHPEMEAAGGGTDG